MIVVLACDPQQCFDKESEDKHFSQRYHNVLVDKKIGIKRNLWTEKQLFTEKDLVAMLNYGY